MASPEAIAASAAIFAAGIIDAEETGLGEAAAEAKILTASTAFCEAGGRGGGRIGSEAGGRGRGRIGTEDTLVNCILLILSFNSSPT